MWPGGPRGGAAPVCPHWSPQSCFCSKTCMASGFNVNLEGPPFVKVPPGSLCHHSGRTCQGACCALSVCVDMPGHCLGGIVSAPSEILCSSVWAGDPHPPLLPRLSFPWNSTPGPQVTPRGPPGLCPRGQGWQGPQIIPSSPWREALSCVRGS